MYFIKFSLNPVVALLLILLTLLLALIHLFVGRRSRSVYLVDFTCHKPPASQMCSIEATVQRMDKYRKYCSYQTLDFMKKILESSGLGDSTYAPESLMEDPPNYTMEAARREVQMSIFGPLDMLFAKTGVEPKDIGIIVVNCCVYNSTPSISSMIINKYKLRDDIKSFNLSGMGCSAGLVAIGLVKHLLQVNPNSYALVVSTESITVGVYDGNDLPMCHINCFFRVGGAAMLLSNRPSDRHLAKYRLVNTVHTNTASPDRSYNCVYQKEDENGQRGITTSKYLIAAATTAIESNLTSVCRLILPLSGKLLFVTDYMIRKLPLSKIGIKIKPYVPDLNNAVDHFFPHVGAARVQDGLQKNLRLTDKTMEASRMTLYRFGNTSSTSVWYELAYAEAKNRVKKGDRLWQMAFGSGFKCSSVIWLAMKNIECDEMNPWSEEINDFPKELEKNDANPFSFAPYK